MVINQKQFRKWKSFHIKCPICHKTVYQSAHKKYYVFTSKIDASWFVIHQKSYENTDPE